jgi:hypothetical protein
VENQLNFFNIGTFLIPAASGVERDIPERRGNALAGNGT